MPKPLRLLIVEDSDDDSELLVMEVRRGGYDPVWARVETAEAMLAALQDETWDVVIADYRMPRFNGIKALELVREYAGHTPFIMVSGYISDEVGAAAMKNGAGDYIMKHDLSHLVPAMEREISQAQQHGRQKQLEHEVERSRTASEIAREIQQQLLPRDAPQLEGFDIAGRSYQPVEKLILAASGQNSSARRRQISTYLRICLRFSSLI